MRCDHEHDDGAYVLGALSPAERAAYERHLSSCSFCREAVADIAVLPGLLGRLDPADFQKLLDPEPPRPASRNRMPALVMAAQSTRQLERRRARRRAFVSALAAACLIVLIGVGAVLWMGRDASEPTGPTVAMQPVNGAVPLSATVNLTGTTGGTKVRVACFYNRESDDSKSYTVRLMGIGPDDERDQMGSWVAAPGREFKMDGVTHLAAGNLSRLELVRNDGQVLLALDVP
jgi:anti-sigma-K factor RskA